LVSQVTSREAEATGRELMRLPYSRSSIERVGHAVGAEYLCRREQVEPRLIETCQLPPGIASVSVSVDRVTVPMEEPVPKEPQRRGRPVRLREETLRKYGHEVSPRTEAVLQEAERAAKESRPKIQRNYRMAYCATVTIHDHDGEALHTLRYGRMPAAVDSLEQLTHRDVHRMMQRLRDDVIALRRRAGSVPVVLLADGAPELWRLFEQHLNEKQIGTAPVKLVDARHALEYVAAAARLPESGEKAWPGTFRRWKSWLLTEADGAERVMHALMSSELQTARDDAGKRPIGDAVRYIQARLALMNYAEARQCGLPIGSGAVEATCKSLVSVRMKRCGSRWKHQSGNEILQLRALQSAPLAAAVTNPARSPSNAPELETKAADAVGAGSCTTPTRLNSRHHPAAMRSRFRHPRRATSLRDDSDSQRSDCSFAIRLPGCQIHVPSASAGSFACLPASSPASSRAAAC
jgi:hypothetical protein